MESPIEPHPPLTADERTPAHHVRAADRVRRLPEALLLTAGYYASRVPGLGELIRRLDRQASSEVSERALPSKIRP